MYAIIRNTKSISSGLRYNEDRLKEGKAQCLLAENFLQESDHLSRKDKLDRFLERTSLNERTQRNTVLISLNFDSSERITNEQMQVLAKRYMQSMGFERQPFLGYRHFDTAHPHLHLITTNINADGNRMHIGVPFLHKSHQITRELENEFSLHHSKSATREEKEQFKVQRAQKVIHGETDLMRSISDVLNTVVSHYKYTSLSELNAILQLYNVKASRGRETSRLYQYRGLIYHATDEKGMWVGKSIKASLFSLKPTLSKLENRFVLNEHLRQENQQRLKTAIDWTLAGRAPDWQEFKKDLEREGISVVVQEDKKGDPEAIYFVDHRDKTVFSGESLGDPYSLRAIRERCAEEQVQEQEEELTHRLHLRL